MKRNVDGKKKKYRSYERILTQRKLCHTRRFESARLRPCVLKLLLSRKPESVSIVSCKIYILCFLCSSKKPPKLID